MIRFLLASLLLLFTAVLLQAQDDAFWPTAVRPFDTAVNTRDGIEIQPLLSADGGTLYFHRKYNAGNVGGEDDPDDIYTMQRDSAGRWFTPSNIGAPLNTPESDIILWISRDGSQALVAWDKLRPVSRHGLGLVRRTATGWGVPVPIMIDGVRPYGDFVYATIAPDERHLILAFASDTAQPESYDLFLCTALDNDLRHWGAPVNLGSGVNSGKFDASPFMGWDNRTLYFASDGHDGVGGMDIYMTRRIGEGWGDWTVPVNIGPGVNSPLDDLSFTVALDGTGVVCSRMGSEHTDLYLAKLPDSLLPRPTVVVEGRVHNGVQGVRGLVRAERKGSAEVTTTSGQDGSFRLFLPPGSTWHIVAMMPGGGGGKAELSLPAVPPASPLKVDLAVKRE